MGGWYRVVKTIKGHQCIYEQQTYRDGNHVRTRNRYVGPSAGDRLSSSSGDGTLRSGSTNLLTVTITSIASKATSFGKAALDQFGGVELWARIALAQLGVSDAKVKIAVLTPRFLGSSLDLRYSKRPEPGFNTSSFPKVS